MLTNISNLGTVLDKSEQKTINGAKRICSDYYCKNDHLWVLAENCICI